MTVQRRTQPRSRHDAPDQLDPVPDAPGRGLLAVPGRPEGYGCVWGSVWQPPAVLGVSHPLPMLGRKAQQFNHSAGRAVHAQNGGEGETPVNVLR